MQRRREAAELGLTVMQLLPALDVGGVERGSLEIAAALVERGHCALVVSAGGRLVEELQSIGATHIECPIGVKSLRTLRQIGRLRDIIRREKVDIVHARSRLPAWIGYRALRGLPDTERPAWVTTVHGPYSVNFYSRIMTSGERVIAISEFIHAYITQHYPLVAAAQIRIIPRGVDRQHYVHGYLPPPSWIANWRSQFPQFEGRRLLVLAGRITRWKGHADFIEMLAELVRRDPSVHGLIAGGASDSRLDFERELKTLAATRGLNDHLTFLGKRDDLRDILALADIAYSLTIEPEAFGRTTIEALSLGTPVIGYNHGGTGEILREVFPQGLVAPRDIVSAVEKTHKFLATNVDVPATHRFTLARMQAQTIKVYEEIRDY